MNIFSAASISLIRAVSLFVNIILGIIHIPLEHTQIPFSINVDNHLASAYSQQVVEPLQDNESVCSIEESGQRHNIVFHKESKSLEINSNCLVVLLPSTTEFLSLCFNNMVAFWQIPFV